VVESREDQSEGDEENVTGIEILVKFRSERGQRKEYDRGQETKSQPTVDKFQVEKYIMIRH